MPTRSEIQRTSNSYKGPVLGTGRFGAPEQGFSDGVETSRTYLWKFTPLFDVLGAQFRFPNWIMGTGGTPAEAMGQNPITVKVGLSNGISPIRQLSFNGAGTAVIQPGADAVSDPFNIPLFASTECQLRVNVSVTSGQKWPLGGGAADNSETGDLALSGTIDDASSVGYGPLDMFGYPGATRTKKGVVIVSDSLALGGGETAYMGYMRRWFDMAGVAWSRLAITSNTIAAMVSNNTAYTLTHALTSPAEIIYCAVAGNSLMGPIIAGTVTTLSQAQAILQPLWTKLGQSGKELWVPTLTPYTGSPALTTAQKNLGYAINDWIRSVPPSVTKCIDVAAAIEVTPNTGVAKSGYMAGDGVHLTQAGATGTATTLNTQYASDFLI